MLMSLVVIYWAMAYSCGFWGVLGSSGMGDGEDGNSNYYFINIIMSANSILQINQGFRGEEDGLSFAKTKAECGPIRLPP